ncbi:CHAP domain-containing protein [Actinophytocola glycyrrhizae]|uniref:CHAP domain-containing protein n=1 Tax=Actinophytocola glycyrrhizae TaxID=2044873 RepID=A0ABV9SAY2_9PSEU
MDSHVIARKVAGQLVAHRDKLAGKAADAHRAQAALEATARAVERHHADHRSTAATATSHWEGKAAAGFDRRARTMGKALDVTAAAAAKGASIVAATAASLATNHRAVAHLVDEYTAKATAILDGARAVQGAGQRAALLRAVGQVVDLVRTYTNESVRHLRAVRREMKDAAEDLRGLERRVEHDGFADPGERKKKHPVARGGALGKKVIDRARGQLGYREGPGNTNKYGPTGPWCANFATWTWQKSGVDIGILPFTGDVYEWGRERGLAYGKNNLDQARPGDVLLFGTGPRSPRTSTHIGIVERVHGNQVTLIEGNSADQVRRVTHTLSSSTFYGGVHPR